MACTGCLETKAQACAGDIKIPARLVLRIGQSVIVKMTDKFNAEYIQEVEVDGDGNIFFDLSDFPEGYFNEHFGAVTFRIYEDLQTDCPLAITATDCNEVAAEYECIRITPAKMVITNTGLLEQENLGLLEQENLGGIIIQE